MTGVLNAMVGGGMVVTNYSVTIGVVDDAAGYSITPFGSISPISTFRGIEIEGLFSFNTADFRVILGSEVAQDYWSAIIVTDGAGGTRSFRSSDASSFVANIDSIWSFGSGSNRVWETTDSGEIKSISFIT